MKSFLPFFLSCLLLACASEKQNEPQLQSGRYRMELQLTDAKTLPFEFDLQEAAGQWQVDILNASEVIEVEDVRFANDSLWIRMPVFDSEFQLVLQGDGQLLGSFFNYSRGLDYQIPARAKKAEVPRFSTTAADFAIEGKWEAVFSDGTEDEYPAVGVFTSEADYIAGTFLTETGDYRFLEGSVSGDSLKLSCFDGAHAFLFEAKLTGDTLRGTFWSGNHWEEPF
ncbi:MAG: TlpA family protein disulfide reductase, partial [Bacteroidota bacterium]